MTRYSEVRTELVSAPRRWLVTGAAGFVASHLVEELLRLGQEVRGLDDLSTGRRENLAAIAEAVGEEAWERFSFVEASVLDGEVLEESLRGVAVVLHQAALGSVPRSLTDPLATHAANATGTLRVLETAAREGAARVVYASSSSVYGDDPGLPRREPAVGAPLSPYAASKRAGELYAAALGHGSGPSSIGLRYFNVVGTRQSADGPYAAVLPRWIAALRAGERPVIHGDGGTTRDFCPVANVVQANLLAATAPEAAARSVYNVGLGRSTTLLELFGTLRDSFAERGLVDAALEPEYGPPRAGDVRHSLADLTRIRGRLGYEPEADLEAALRELVEHG